MYCLEYRKTVAEIFMLTQHKVTSLHASSIDTQRLTEPDGHNRVDSFVSKTSAPRAVIGLPSENDVPLPYEELINSRITWIWTLCFVLRHNIPKTSLQQTHPKDNYR
jgi:hypothetical protein